MFGKHEETGYIKALEGIEPKTLVFGEHTLMSKFILLMGYELPMHKHSQEQIGYLIEGHILLTIGEEQRDMYPGDSWNVPEGIIHGAKIIEDSIALEVFSPIREDYLPQLIR